MMIMMKMMQSFGEHDEEHHSTRHGCDGNGRHNCDDNYGFNGVKTKDNMMRMMMRRMMNSESHDRMDSMDMDHMDMDMFSKMFKSMKSNNYDSYKSDDFSPMMKRFMGGFQKRQADDSLELNDRLKEKLENLMQ